MKESVTWKRDQGQFTLLSEEDFMTTDNTLIVSERMKYTQQVSCIPLNMDMCTSKNKLKMGIRKSGCESTLQGNAKAFKCNSNSDVHFHGDVFIKQLGF